MMFKSYETEKVMDSYGNIYLLQYGSYTEKKVMEENIKKINDYVVVSHDNKYYVYLGVFTNIETAKEMQELFKNKNIYTYLKNDYLSDTSIISEIRLLDEELLNEKNSLKKYEINGKMLNILKKSIS